MHARDYLQVAIRRGECGQAGQVINVTEYQTEDLIRNSVQGGHGGKRATAGGSETAALCVASQSSKPVCHTWGIYLTKSLGNVGFGRSAQSRAFGRSHHV